MKILMLVLAAVIGYLMGNIPTGIWIGKLYGVGDIRKTGSGNIGTTNVLRTLGWLPSVMTLVGDALKGVIAALIGRRLGGDHGMLLAALFAVVGHNYPVSLGFKGGKGIATSLGVTFVVCTPVAPCLMIIAFTIVGLTGYMSIGSLTASLAYPFLIWWLLPDGKPLGIFLVFAVLLLALSVFQHRANISRLIHGSENRLDFHRISKLSKGHNLFHKKHD